MVNSTGVIMWSAIKSIGQYVKYLPAVVDAINLLREEGKDVWKEIQDLRVEIKDLKDKLQQLREEFPPPPSQ